MVRGGGRLPETPGRLTSQQQQRKFPLRGLTRVKPPMQSAKADFPLLSLRFQPPVDAGT
jgi:hypothetical protein